MDQEITNLFLFVKKQSDKQKNNNSSLNPNNRPNNPPTHNLYQNSTPKQSEH